VELFVMVNAVSRAARSREYSVRAEDSYYWAYRPGSLRPLGRVVSVAAVLGAIVLSAAMLHA
jgi:hypothetical protein